MLFKKIMILLRNVSHEIVYSHPCFLLTLSEALKMRIHIICIQVVLLLAHLTVANACKVHVKENAVVKTDQNLWKPNNLVKFSNTTFCFQTVNVAPESLIPSEQLLCSFNKGSSFVAANTNLPFCGSGGIFSDGQLYCPHKKIAEGESTSLIYSTIVFTAQNEIIEGKISSKQVSFQTKPNFALKEIRFNGEVQYISSGGFYMMTATVIDSNDLESSYLFRSVNGFDWSIVESLPLGPSDEMHLQIQSGEKISIVAKNNHSYHKVTSENMGKSWSSVEHLNTTSPPFSIAFPSSIVVEYAMSNHTPGELAFLSPLLPENASNSFLQLNDFKQLLDNVNGNSLATSISTSHYAVSAQVSSMPLQIIVIHDEVDQGKFILHSTLIEIDDSEEKHYLDVLLLEEAKMKEKKRLINQKAKQEGYRKEMEKQKKNHERSQKRRRRFAEFDRPCIERALEDMKHDNEFIVVRQVKEEFIDLENEALW